MWAISNAYTVTCWSAVIIIIISGIKIVVPKMDGCNAIFWVTIFVLEQNPAQQPTFSRTHSPSEMNDVYF